MNTMDQNLIEETLGVETLRESHDGNNSNESFGDSIHSPESGPNIVIDQVILTKFLRPIYNNHLYKINNDTEYS